MKKRDKIEKLLSDAGFEITSDFSITIGPKTKRDCLECWNVDAFHKGKHVTVYSAYTMTHLCNTGLEIVPNYDATCLYGDYVAQPK